MAGERVPILSCQLRSDLVCPVANLAISPVIAQISLLRIWPARLNGGDVRPSHVTDVNGRVWALTCRAETPGDSSEQPRVRGRPYTKVFDEEGFEVVQGGFRPLPRGVSVGDFVRPSTKPRQRAQHAHASAAKFFRNDPTPPTPATAESQEGSSPLTDDGKRAAHLTMNTPSGQAAKAETQRTLAMAKTHEQLIDFAACELDRRQQRYSDDLQQQIRTQQKRYTAKRYTT